MGYEDFIVFFMCEEDKSSPSSVRYWFKVCDIDDDGYLTFNDMKQFYMEQEQRMRDYGMEVISFKDILCQMHDLIQPKVRIL